MKYLNLSNLQNSLFQTSRFVFRNRGPERNYHIPPDSPPGNPPNYPPDNYPDKPPYHPSFIEHFLDKYSNGFPANGMTEDEIKAKYGVDYNYDNPYILYPRNYSTSEFERLDALKRKVEDVAKVALKNAVCGQPLDMDFQAFSNHLKLIKDYNHPDAMTKGVSERVGVVMLSWYNRQDNQTQQDLQRIVSIRTLVDNVIISINFCPGSRFLYKGVDKNRNSIYIENPNFGKIDLKPQIYCGLSGKMGMGIH